MESYEPKDTRYKHMESFPDRKGNNLSALFPSLWGNKTQLTPQDTKRHKTQNKQDEGINAQLITSRTMNDYRNSPTINFCADLFPDHIFPSIK